MTCRIHRNLPPDVEPVEADSTIGPDAYSRLRPRLKWWWWLLVGAICGLAFAMLFLSVPVRAHEASSGWTYPWACCANIHCHPVPCESLDERPGGVVIWRGLTFDGSMVKVTGDKDCHVCHELEDGKPVRPHCVFVRPMS